MREHPRLPSAWVDSRNRRAALQLGPAQKPIPYQRKAARWVGGLLQRIHASDLTPTVRTTMLAAYALQEEEGRQLDFVPSQLAKLGRCSVRTIQRAIPDLLAQGLLHQVEAPCHELRLAGVYQLVEGAMSFRAFARSSQTTDRRSPGASESPSGPRPAPSVPGTPCGGPHSPTSQEGQGKKSPAAPPVAGWEEALQLVPEERLVVERLRELGEATGERAHDAGLKAVVKHLRRQSGGLPKACAQAQQDLRVAEAYLATGPAWVKSPMALLTKAILRASFAEQLAVMLQAATKWRRIKERRKKREAQGRGGGRKLKPAPDPVNAALVTGAAPVPPTPTHPASEPEPPAWFLTQPEWLEQEEDAQEVARAAAVEDLFREGRALLEAYPYPLRANREIYCPVWKSGRLGRLEVLFRHFGREAELRQALARVEDLGGFRASELSG